MKHLLVFFAMCTLAAAMSPREKRDTNGTQIICAAVTPCGWQVYNPVTKQIQVNVTNTYCICGEGLACNITEDNTTSSTYVMKCREPGFVPDTDFEI